MKLNKLKNRVLELEGPNGGRVQITFMKLAQMAYDDSPAKNRLTLNKFILVNRKHLEATWKDLVEKTAQQVEKNNKPTRKLWLKVKYTVKRYIKALKRLFTGL